MAIAIDSQGSGYSIGAENVSSSAWTPSGSNLCVTGHCGYQGWNAGNKWTGMKWGGSGGTDMTQVGTVESSGNESHGAMHYKANPSVGSYTLYGYLSQAQDAAVIGGASWTGVHQTTTVGNSGQANGSDGTPTVGVSSVSGDVVVGMAFNAYSSTMSCDDTEIWAQENPGSSGVAGAGSYEAGASVTLSYTCTADIWVAIAFALKPAGAGPSETFFEDRHPIVHGMKPQTAAGMGGILIEDRIAA